MRFGGLQYFPGHRDRTATIKDAHRQHREPLSECGRIQGQCQLLAVPAFDDPAQPRRPTGAQVKLAALVSGFGRRFAVKIAEPFAQRVEFLLQDGNPGPSYSGQGARPCHDHAEAPQRQASDHRLAQMRKSLANNVVPLIKSRKVRHGSSPVSGSVYYNSVYQEPCLTSFVAQPRNLHQKGPTSGYASGRECLAVPEWKRTICWSDD